MALLLLAGAAASAALLPSGSVAAQSAAGASATKNAASPAAWPRPQPPTIAQALQSGVLIVISKASQRMHVFKDGAPWLSSPVSTGRRGHTTPAGVFPILEKQKFHRSNIYSNAPMPFMQRLTSGGIAIHAGYVPGHPASHGCIRVPLAVARSLFGVTRARETIVVILNAAMQSDAQARRMALGVPQTQAPPVALAAAAVPMANDTGPAVPAAPPVMAQPMPDVRPRPGGGQTIQLVAALSPQEAEARWSWLLGLHAELGRLDKTVVPVAVGAHRYFRLRASGPGAFATCSALKGAGIDCFRVI
jgi:hypothetical protein